MGTVVIVVGGTVVVVVVLAEDVVAGVAVVGTALTRADGSRRGAEARPATKDAAPTSTRASVPTDPTTDFRTGQTVASTSAARSEAWPTNRSAPLGAQVRRHRARPSAVAQPAYLVAPSWHSLPVVSRDTWKVDFWKASYLRMMNGMVCFGSLTADDKHGPSLFGVHGENGPYWAVTERADTWRKDTFSQLSNGRAVQLRVQLHDPVQCGPRNVQGVTQDVTGVFVPLLCRGPSDKLHRPCPADDLVLRVDGERVLPSCRTHAGDAALSLAQLSGALRVPVAPVEADA
jgi:hypothetical protein